MSYNTTRLLPANAAGDPIMADVSTDEARSNCRRRLYSLSSKVHRGVSSYFDWHGAFVSRYPWRIILLTLLVAAGLTFEFFNIHEQNLEPKELFTPQDAQSFRDKEVYEKFYGIPPSQTRIYVTRRTDASDPVECKNRGLMGDADTARTHFLEMFSLIDLISSIQAEYKGAVYTVEDLCEKKSPDGPCTVMTILSAWNYSVSALLTDPDPIRTVKGSFIDATGKPSSVEYLLGISRDTTECPDNVEAIQSWLILNYLPEHINGAVYDPRNKAWNRQLLTVLNDRWRNRLLDVYVSSLDGVESESEALLDHDTRLLKIAYLVVLVYCSWALFKNNWAQCKAHLAIVSWLSVVMATGSTYGLCQLFEIEFNPVDRVLPFLLMGLGVDDTFVIMSDYHNTDVSMSVIDRIRKTCSRAGSAILVTSVTDFVAFLAGTFTKLKALHDFSIYAAFGVLFDFIYQITFFLAFLVLDARRERRDYDKIQSYEEPSVNGYLAASSDDQSDHDDLNGHVDRNGGVIMSHNIILGYQSEKSIENGIDKEKEDGWDEEDRLIHRSNIERSRKRKLIGCGEYKPGPSFASRLVGRWLPKITLTFPGTLCILFIELLLIALSIYGCSNVVVDFRYEEWFVPSDSNIHKAFQIERDYFLGNQIPFHAVTIETYADAHYHNQHQLKNFARRLRSDPHVAETPPIRFWFEDFTIYAEEKEPSSVFHNGTFRSPEAFSESLHRFLKGPGEVYRSEVAFDDDGRLKAAKTVGFTEDIGSSWGAVRTVDSIRRTVEQSAPELNPIAYSYGFLYYDGYRVIAWETIRNVSLAAVAVFFVTLIILANLIACICVLLMVILTDLMLFGAMWYLHLTFNGVTCICMVLAVGIAVDYSVHIAHAFLTVEGSRKERAEQALHHIGGAVLNGAFTTGLAIAVLGFARHYIQRTFFKMLSAIVICGVWHGLIVLPAMLSLIGPRPYRP